VSFAHYEQDVTQLVQAAIAAADPARRVDDVLTAVSDRVYVGDAVYRPERVILIGVGKAAVPMAATAIAKLGSRVKEGIVVGKRAKTAVDLPAPLRYFQGGHPVPTSGSVQAAEAIRTLLATGRATDLVLCLISGGTSALLTQPVLPLAQWQALTTALLHSGCPINELNTIRQQFDAVKGGGLARWAAPAACAALILSDVIGNNLAHIGSGPTVPTPPNPVMAREILDRYRVWERLDGGTAVAVNQHLATPFPPEPLSTLPVHNQIIGDVTLAAQAAAQQAAVLGFVPTIVSTALRGEAREIGQMAAKIAGQTPPGRCLIWGGESTVTVRGNGRGGRNQEIALAAALALDGAPGGIIASFATDGEDGPTPVAGAIVSGGTVARAANQGLNAAAYLAANDSYHFFARLGQGHIVAEQGTNVNDLLLVLTYPEAV
jgi:glycerate 2-kinase